MRASIRIERQILTITVSSGTGSATFTAHGKLNSIGFKMPSGTPTYDFEIVDSASFGVAGKTGLSGKTTLGVDKLCTDLNTITISNATVDGDYLVRLWIEQGV